MEEEEEEAGRLLHSPAARTDTMAAGAPHKEGVRPGPLSGLGSPGGGEVEACSRRGPPRRSPRWGPPGGFPAPRGGRACSPGVRRLQPWGRPPGLGGLLPARSPGNARRATAPLLGNRVAPSGAPPGPRRGAGPRAGGPARGSQSARAVGTHAGRRALPLAAAPATHSPASPRASRWGPHPPFFIGRPARSLARSSLPCRGPREGSSWPTAAPRRAPGPADGSRCARRAGLSFP